MSVIIKLTDDMITRIGQATVEEIKAIINTNLYPNETQERLDRHKVEVLQAYRKRLTDLYIYANIGVQKSIKFNLMTFNIWERSKLKTGSDFVNFLNTNGNPQIVCTQEDLYNSSLSSQKYFEANRCKGETLSNGDIISNKIYLDQNFTHYLQNNEDLKVENACSVERCASIVELQFVFGINLKIGNIHLCGGRYDDPGFSNKLEEKNLEIQTLIGKNPDIICGDFNSYKNKEQLDKFGSKYGAYIGAKQHNKEEEYKIWATGVHDILKLNGYIPVENDVDTTMYGGVVDWIYYKNSSNKKFNVRGVSVIKCMNGEKPPYTPILSDHNAVNVMFEIN